MSLQKGFIRLQVSNPNTPVKTAWAKAGLVALLLLLGLLCGIGLTQLFNSQQVAQSQRALDQMDIPFLQHMSLHHDQALTLSQIMQSKFKANSIDPRLYAIQSLAKNIEVSQRLELGIFRGWLMQWEREFIPRQINMDWMIPGANEDELAFISRCRASGGGMEGMASMEEINRLSDANLEAASEQFLELMFRHHEAAIPMLAYASRRAHNLQVRQLALAMWSDQRKELLMIQRLKKS